MKKILLNLFIIAFVANVSAQLKTPKPSPSGKIEQTVGLTDVIVEYSRPSVKGRKIFGDLVPFDKVWRTGANNNTKVTFTTDVTIDGKKLKKGTYALYTKPTTSSWEVYFYNDTKNWGTPKKWDDNKVVLTTSVKTEKIPVSIESFTITIDNLSNNGALLGLMWENTYVGIPFEVPTDKIVAKNIEKVMSGPSAQDYYASAAYYLSEGKDIHKAKEWIDKAVEMTKENPKFYFLRRQALIYAKAGDKKGAIKAAKASLKYAEKAKNDGYIKQNKASLKEWGA